MNWKKIGDKIKEYLSIEILYLTFAVVTYLLYRYLSFNPSVLQFMLDHIYKVETSDSEVLHYYRNITWFITSFFTLFLIPVVISTLIYKKQVWSKMGLKITKSKLGFGLLIGATLFMFLIIIIALRIFPSFSEYYPMTDYVRTSTKHMIIYQICYFCFFIGWEFYFHSFLVFPYEAKMGKIGAMIIGTLPFVIVHIGKPFPEVMGSFVANLFLVFLALETRSFWFGMLMHGLIAVFMEVASVYFI